MTQNDIIHLLLQKANDNHFTLVQLLVFAFGFIFWELAYIFIFLDGRKNKVNEMPMLAAAGNLAWEMLWSFWFTDTPLGFLFQLGCICWFIADIFINHQILTKNRLAVRNQWIRKNYFLIYGFALINFFFILYFMAKGGADNSLGVQSGLLLNLFMSALYIYQLIQSPTFRGKSYTMRVAVFKMLGTTSVTIASYLIWPDNYYILSMGIATILLDVAYVYLFKTYQPELHARQEYQESKPVESFDIFSMKRTRKNNSPANS